MILSWSVLLYALASGFLVFRLRRLAAAGVEDRLMTGAGWVLMGASFSLAATLLAVAAMLLLS